jgi:drug/metabolite transporter (DMT)-like permease
MANPVRNILVNLLDVARGALHPLKNPQRSDKTKAIAAVGLVSFMWGTTWLVSARGVAAMPVLQLSGIRHLIGGSLYIAFFTWKGHPWPTRGQFFQFLWMGLIMFLISNGLSTWSVKFIPSGMAAVIGAISPIWIALFSLLMFRESKLNLMTGIGLMLGFSGILVVFSDHLRSELTPTFITGTLMGLVASMTWAIGTLYTVRHAKNLDPYYSLGWQMFLSGIMFSSLAMSTGQVIPINSIPFDGWFAISYLVLLGSIMTFAAFIYALKRLPPAQASIYAYINPIVAVILGALLNHEQLSLTIALGTLITLTGVFLVNTGFRRSSRREVER